MEGDLFKVGQWTKFHKGTCFGKEKDHIGIIVGIGGEGLVAIAVNATSKVVGVTMFADQNGIDPLETIVVIKPDDERGAHHFSRSTAFDCNRPVHFSVEQMRDWIRNNKIELVSYNQEVSLELLEDIKLCILKSPMVPEKYKKIIRE